MARPAILKFIMLVFASSAVAHASPSHSPSQLNAVLSAHDPVVTGAVTFQDTLGFNGVWACDVRTVEITGKDPIAGLPRKVTIKIYAPQSHSAPQTLRTVIVMPPTGGVNKIDTAYASALCFKSFRAVVIEGWELDTPYALDLDAHDQSAVRSLESIRQVIDYLQPQRAGQIGILGSSIGAIEAAVALAIDSRLSCGALIVGGVDLADIISTSDEPHMTALRTQRMAAYGYTSVDEYRSALREHIHLEPADVIAQSTNKKIWQLIALKDTTVPTTDQYRLQSLFGGQPVTTVNDDHFKAIITAYVKHQNDIYKFFEDNLN